MNICGWLTVNCSESPHYAKPQTVSGHFKRQHTTMKQPLIFILILFGLSSASHGQTSDQTDKLLPNDFKDIFQLAIDHPQLQQYYHVDTDTSRRQIIFQFFGNANHNKLRGVTKFGRQVIIMTESEIKQSQIKSYFVVGDWVCGTNSVRLQLEYPIEGLLVSYMFKKINDKWTITSFNLEES